MVEAIGAAIIAAFTASAALASAIATTTVLGVSIGTIVGTAVVLGGSLLVSALTTPDTRQKVQAQQFSTRQSLPPRRRVYGRTKLAGPKVEWKGYNGCFVNALYHCEGPIGGYDEFWFEDKKSALPSGSLGGFTGIAPWQQYVSVEAHLGTEDQIASNVLTTRLPWWTANDRLAGCAYTVAFHAPPAEKDFKKFYPSGTWPEHRVVLRGSVVRNVNDPAQTSNPATWQWSETPALCIRDHLTHQLWGMKVPESLIDDVSFGAKAFTDSAPVTRKDGAVIARYALGGAFDLTEEPADVLQGMLNACDGRLFLTVDGKIGISGGTYVAPEVTLRDPQIISVTVEKGSKKRASFNRMKISYVSPRHDYQVIEGDPWEDYDAQSEAGEILETDFARPWVQDHNQLRRLAKIFCAKGNPEWRITGMVTDRSGLPALFEDIIRLVLPRYGIDAVFTVDRAVASADGSTCTFDMTSLDPTCYDFNAATEEGITPALPNESTGAEPLAPPAGLLAYIERRAVGGNVNAAFLVLTASPPGRLDLSLIGRYRRVGTTDWIDMRADSDSRSRVVSDVLADGVEYEPQGALAGYDRAAQSVWLGTNPSTILATSDNVAPAAPTYTSATLAGTTVNHAVKQSSSANARNIRLSRANGFGKVFADAALSVTEALSPNQTDTLTDTISLGYITWWLTAQNASGVSSTASDPKSLLYVTQPNTKNSFPNDLSNAEWVRNGIGQPVAQGTGPDGAQATFLPELATAGAHNIAYRATGLTSGGKVRTIWGLKAAGRTNGRVELMDTNGSAFARFVFDLAAGTVTTSTNSGGVFTATTASIVKLPNDWWLVIVTAAAATTAVENRMLIYSGPTTTSYAGDTTKGLLAWACSFAPVT